jgi:hypothetical protein
VLGVMRSTLAIVALLLLASTCRKKSLPEPAVDRSDGKLPELEVPHVAAGEIAIDGRATEAAWDRAAHTGLFVRPGDGRPALESRANASARIAWNAEHLYLSFVVYDPEPSTPFSRSDLDPHIWEKASGVEVMIQPGDFADNKSYYELQVDVGGAVWDTQFEDYNHPIVDGPDGRVFGHTSWASGVRRAVAIDADAGRYTIELALPWASLGRTRAPAPPRPGDVWRLNLYAFRDGQSDATAWSPLLGKGNFHRTARFGRLRFAAPK